MKNSLPFLAYCDAYQVHCELTLQSGRKVTLKRLDQRMTYEGLLEGVPSAWMNDRIVRQAMEDAKRFPDDTTNCHLIEPVRRDYLRESGDMSGLRSPGGAPEWLPMIRCLATFSSSTPARDKNCDGSNLNVVWFQEDFAFPIRDVVSELECIDWDRLATDFCY